MRGEGLSINTFLYAMERRSDESNLFSLETSFHCLQNKRRDV
ncbi:hypothetical protein Pla52o_09080 [Novipirellula galeiformis]|uniref:Uncharacterized protein n=1 Tax=Novipirellula galeiformis TaxID=2528004 RepID=A0A5C6CWQ6_9BACT|nr:hypothetical protein Pla52o_09080 [Novipirellula galeiformis]